MPTRMHFSWSGLQPSEWRRLRRQRGQCSMSESEQRRPRRARPRRRTQKCQPPRSMTMRSNNCGPKYRRRRSSEHTWQGLEQSRKNRNLRTRVSSVLDTGKILFQNVTSFGHKARTWLLSDQMNYDIVGVAKHHLDVTQAADEAGRLRAEGYRSIWAPANLTRRGGTSGGTMAMIKPHWKFSRYLEGYGDFAEPLKRWDWTPIVWHLKGLTVAVVFAYFSTGDDAQAANQVTRFARHSPLLPISTWSPTSCGRLAGAEPWSEGQHCRA